MKRLRASVAGRVPLLGGLIRPPRVAHDVLDVCGIGACEPLDGDHVRGDGVGPAAVEPLVALPQAVGRPFERGLGCLPRVGVEAQP